uniref:Uncharacterized protein n=1 Tax=Cacopsylla melanoneura TaxID=428564 RepID=A0A8D9BGD7_9HEMI
MLFLHKCFALIFPRHAHLVTKHYSTIQDLVMKHRSTIQDLMIVPNISYPVESLLSPDKRNTYTYLQSSQGGGFSDFAFNVQCSPHVILILESMSLKGGDQFQFSLDH